MASKPRARSLRQHQGSRPGVDNERRQTDCRKYVKCGAVGFLLKDCTAEELTLAINDTVAGHPHLASAITGKLVENYLNSVRQKHPATRAGLTPAECQVLKQIADGKSNKEMAAALNISIKTVEAHRTNIVNKLNLHGTAELTKFAISVGLTSLSNDTLER